MLIAKKRVCEMCIGLLLMILLSCSNANNAAATNSAGKTVLSSIMDSGSVKFDLLDTLFRNENWLLAEGRDTSFIYCSRLGKTYYKTYYYRMHNGDSTATVESEVRMVGNDVVWSMSPIGTELLLVNIAANKAIWKNSSGNSWTFQKIDTSNIHINRTGRKRLHLKRTITLSSFLIMSKFDYKHGTNLAYENIK